ncbi:MAG: hypothetical protein Q9220_004111 [cf. Caloplaca sp. 1 TL-2023]
MMSFSSYYDRTGISWETPSPEWQLPKYHASTRAIALWENQNVTQKIRSDNHRRQRHSRPLNATFRRPGGLRSKKYQPTLIQVNPTKRFTYQDNQTFRPKLGNKSSHTDVSVLISQHSSLDRDEYVLYRSSLSTCASTCPPQSQSFPPPAASSSTQSLPPEVIPDSQSASTSSVISDLSDRGRLSIPESSSNPASGFFRRDHNLQQVHSTRNEEISRDISLEVSIVSKDLENSISDGSDTARTRILDYGEFDFQANPGEEAKVLSAEPEKSSSRPSEVFPKTEATILRLDPLPLRAADKQIGQNLLLKMSEIVTSRFPENGTKESPRPQSETPGLIPKSEQMKQVRAVARANEAARRANRERTHSQPSGSPLRTPKEPSSATLPPTQGNNSQLPPSTLPADSPPRTYKQSPIRQEAVQSTGPPQGSQVMQTQSFYEQPQSAFPGHPQVYTSPDQQSRFLVQPLSVPIGVPVSIRASQNTQHVLVGPDRGYNQSQPSHVPKTATLQPYGLGTNEHTISLAMNSRVRDQYTSTINMFRRPIEDLMSLENPDEDCLQEIVRLLTRVNNITTHSDLDAQESLETSSQVSPEDEATWAENCSFKFQFLHHLIEQVRYHDVHISVVAQSGRLLDMMETYLRGRGVHYFRPDGRGASSPNDERFAGCRCQFSIVPSGPEGMNLAVKPALLIVALDASFNAQDPQVYRMRVQPSANWMMPIVHLLVYKSAEHITRCLPVQMDRVDRVKKIVSCMTQMRHQVGVLQIEDTEVVAAAEEVAITLRLGGQENRWTLPAIRPLPLDFIEASHEDSTQNGSQSSLDRDGLIQSSALKRAWDSETNNSEPAKRQRRSPAGNVSHVSDSISQNSQMDQLQRQNAFLQQENSTLKFQINSLTLSLHNLKDELTMAARVNKDLYSKASIQTISPDHLADLEASLSSLQTRYENKNRSHRHLDLEKTDLLASLEKSKQKLETQSTELAHLKTLRKTLESDLEGARADLLASSTPDIARIAVAESSARASATELATLTKKTDNLTSDLDFTRSAYQSASTSAADLAAQVTTLTSQLEIAERKAGGEAVRLATINRDTAVKDARRQVRVFKAMLEERERYVRRKEEEIVELKGRRAGKGVVTRGGSVQPGVAGGEGGKGGKMGSPRGSRGGSPVVGGGGGLGGEGMRRGGSGLRGEVVG